MIGDGYRLKASVVGRLAALKVAAVSSPWRTRWLSGRRQDQGVGIAIKCASGFASDLDLPSERSLDREMPLL